MKESLFNLPSTASWIYLNRFVLCNWNIEFLFLISKVLEKIRINICKSQDIVKIKFFGQEIINNGGSSGSDRTWRVVWIIEICNMWNLQCAQFRSCGRVLAGLVSDWNNLSDWSEIAFGPRIGINCESLCRSVPVSRHRNGQMSGRCSFHKQNF